MDTEQKPELPTETPAQPPVNPPAAESRWRRMTGWYGSHKKLAIPATVLLLAVIWLAVPWSRYTAAGLVVKKDFAFTVLDSTSHSPVSGATVTSGSQSAQTDGNGKASLHLGAGRHNLAITKKYYKDQQASVMVPILAQKSTPSFDFTATGRQAKIVVRNLINHQTLADVNIKVADITSTTDNEGEALVVLPAGSTEHPAILAHEGYNDTAVTVNVSPSSVAENNFNLTPAGKVYFISKRTGKLDLMKSNLDGSDAKVVAAATGREHDYDTQLLVSPDTKYVALLSRRSADYNSAQIYVLSTANDKLLGVDNAKADFSLVGWAGSNLIYTVNRTALPEWQPGYYKLKSYDAATGKITLLNQSSAAGDEAVYGSEYYPFIMISGQIVVYAKSWSLYYDDELPETLQGKQNTLSLIAADGQGYKRLAAYDANDFTEYSQHSPNGLYIWQYTNDDPDGKFYDYTVGASAPKSIKLDGDQFYDQQQLPFTSASGQKTLWSEYRDGKYSLFVGDGSGLNPKTISSLGKFDAYGWYGDDYILVTKDSTELYVMDAGGGKPVKITDFEPTGYYGHG
jgi:hypothetical protein